MFTLTVCRRPFGPDVERSRDGLCRPRLVYTDADTVSASAEIWTLRSMSWLVLHLKPSLQQGLTSRPLKTPCASHGIPAAG